VARNNDSDGKKFDGRERRKKVRRSGKERRDRSRWDMSSPIRRKSPGRRALDRLLKETDNER